MKTLGALKAVFKAMTDGVFIMNQDYVIEFMNQSMIADFGEGVGRKCHEVIHGHGDICTNCRNDEIFDGEAFQEEVFIPSVNKMYDVSRYSFFADDGRIFNLSIFRDITANKKRELQLIDSEKNYQQLFQYVGCGVYVSSKEGKFLDANPALLKMLGYTSKEEFLAIDITNDLYMQPEDRKKFRQMIECDGQVIDYEVNFKRKDGTPVPMLLTSHVRYGARGNVLGYEGIIFDLSQRKQMEKEIHEKNVFLYNIIQNSPNAIMATDMKGNFTIWNSSAAEILGYDTSEVIGKMNIRAIYPEGMAKKVMQLLRGSNYNRPGRLSLYPVVHMRKDGQMVEGNLSAAIVYDENGKEIATVGIFVDLKERLEMERRLKLTQDQLLQSEKLAAMGRLTSQIAHELNNPLYGIMNTLELLKTEIPVENRRRKILEMALSETMRLSGLLRKMLMFSKPDQEIKQPTDINIILDEILTLHEKQLKEYSIQVVADLAQDLEPVFASKNQLRQVFLNIIGNARDAMSEGGALSVKTTSDGAIVTVDISDTGIGIKEEHLDKIFDAFFTTKSSVKGVGLGLSVCYGFIRDHSGDIKVRSTWGSGTTFTITLPVYQENAHDSAAV